MLIIICCLLSFARRCEAQWVQVNTGIEGASIKKVTADGNNLFAPTGGGLFYSSNNGIDWIILKNGITNFNVSSVAITGNKVYIGTYGGGVFRSTDYGLSWTQVNTGMTSVIVESISATGNYVYAGTLSEIFRSTNSGDNWELLNEAPAGTINSIIAYDSIVFASRSSSHGIFRSTNYGMNWIDCSLWAYYLSKCGNYVYATTASTIFESADNGGTWTDIIGDMPEYDVREIAKIGETLYAGGTGGVYRSTNHGMNWTAFNTGLTNQNIKSITSNSTKIFAGAGEGSGVFSISNSGSTWTATNRGLYNVVVKDISSYGNNLITAVPNKGVCISTNGGTDWTVKSNGLTNKDVNCVASLNNILIAGTIYPNQSWGAYYSSDFGSNWVNVNSGPVFYHFLVDGNKVYAAAMGSISTSSNSGINWEFISPGVEMTKTVCKKGNKLFSGGYFGISMTTNNGQTWQPSSNGLPDSAGHPVVNFLYADSTVVYAGLRDYGMFMSFDNGLSWVERNNGLPDLTINRIYKSGNYVLAGTASGGVYASSNYGLNWESKNEGLLNLNITSFYEKNGYIYVGTSGLGVWRRSAAEIVGVQSITSKVPEKCSLSQNYPNPFNPRTVIRYQISEISEVVLKIYDINGRELQTLVNKSQTPGTYSVTFNGSGLSSGVYFYKLTAGDFSTTRKMYLIK